MKCTKYNDCVMKKGVEVNCRTFFWVESNETEHDFFLEKYGHEKKTKTQKYQNDWGQEGGRNGVFGGRKQVTLRAYLLQWEMRERESCVLTSFPFPHWTRKDSPLLLSFPCAPHTAHTRRSGAASRTLPNRVEAVL